MTETWKPEQIGAMGVAERRAKAEVENARLASLLHNHIAQEADTLSSILTASFSRLAGLDSTRIMIQFAFNFEKGEISGTDRTLSIDPAAAVKDASPIETARARSAHDLKEALCRPFSADDATEAYFAWLAHDAPPQGMRTWIDAFRAGSDWCASLGIGAVQAQAAPMVRLEARPADNSHDWTEIFPSQLEWVVKAGHQVRAIENSHAATELPSQPTSHHDATTDYQELRASLAGNITLFSHHRAALLRLVDEKIAHSGGTLDDSTFSQIEDALDAIDAPMKNGDRYMTLVERIKAMRPVRVGPQEAAATTSSFLAPPLGHPEGDAFRGTFPHLDLSTAPDAWGRVIFEHSHVQALWEGWCRRAAHDAPRVNDPRVIASITSHVAANILIAEAERQSRVHDLLETIREQVRLGVAPEHRPEGLFKNVQDALYAMRGRNLLNDVIEALLSSRSIDVRLLRDLAVHRFLSWPLPADFSPDGGITLAPHYVAATGTNLFNALQAGAMVDHMLRLAVKPDVISNPDHSTFCPDCGTHYPARDRHLCPFPSRL
jgi:hypothetical protein